MKRILISLRNNASRLYGAVFGLMVLFPVLLFYLAGLGFYGFVALVLGLLILVNFLVILI